ncbi:MAG: hypothetical protein AAF645_13080 [Myxococcota bacterium]
MAYRIDDPCDANWDRMSPIERGRHCATCQTPIIDATDLTRAEMDALVRDAPPACVRLRVGADGNAIFRGPRRRSLGGVVLVSALLVGCGSGAETVEPAGAESAGAESPAGVPLASDASPTAAEEATAEATPETEGSVDRCAAPEPEIPRPQMILMGGLKVSP